MGVTSHLTPELWQKELLFTRSIAAKLYEATRSDLSAPLEDCHTRETHCHCLNCGQVQSFWNRCDRFYCPLCVSKLVFKRRKSIQVWCNHIPQPKHAVLTARNRNSLTHEYVKWFKTQICKLRRLNTNTQWRGGLYSLEVTNESKGWHLHSHLLVDTDWIPADQLARDWARLVEQDFAIVYVTDCRDQSYLQEVTKYAIKGSELAQKSGMEIAEFIDAMTGIRQFSCFGSLFKQRAEVKKLIDDMNQFTPTCKSCESENLRYLDENENEWLLQTGQWPKKF